MDRNLTKCNKVWLVPRGDDGTEVLISKQKVVIDQVLGVFKENQSLWSFSKTYRTLLQ